MQPTRRSLLLSALGAGWGAIAPAWALPAAAAALPSARQMRWHALETCAFVHFSINTFTGKEWGYGDESPAQFDPAGFDAGQIVACAKSAGLRGIVLTAKHHDGFCLWPSAYTEHCIRNSPYRGGRGDIVAEMAQACREQGLAFGLYLSPWDRNHPDYGKPAYVEYYRAQLRELLTGYGELFELWFDNANGGDGYYGGARETRAIDAASYYDWPATWRMVRELQPNAVIWGGAGSDIRWVGNEDGYAGDPCWATMDTGAFSVERNQSGVRGGAQWRPAEADVSIRPGWFWHAGEDDQVKTPSQLMRIYLQSVGRGAGLLLNLAPDRHGRIPPGDAASLRAWGALRQRIFSRDLAQDARRRQTGAELLLELPRDATFNLLRLRERLALGHRVSAYAVDVWQGGAARGWIEVARGSAIGYQRLLELPQPVTARRLRLRILAADAAPEISEFGVFLMPTDLTNT